MRNPEDTKFVWDENQMQQHLKIKKRQKNF